MEDCAGCTLSTPDVCPFVRRVRPRGHRLFRAGAPAEALYRVASGEVLLTLGAQALALRGPDTVVGLEAAGGGVYATDATCETVTEVCVLASTLLPAFAGRSPASALELLRSASAEIHRWSADAAGRGNCTARLAAFLLERPRGAPPLRRSTIAALLRMRPETLSRSIRSLAARGALQAGSLEVNDRSALERAVRESLE